MRSAHTAVSSGTSLPALLPGPRQRPVNHRHAQLEPIRDPLQRPPLLPQGERFSRNLLVSSLRPRQLGRILRVRSKGPSHGALCMFSVGAERLADGLEGHPAPSKSERLWSEPLVEAACPALPHPFPRDILGPGFLV